jgi:hypothetical protein
MTIRPCFIMLSRSYLEEEGGRGSYISEIVNIAGPRLPIVAPEIVITVGFMADVGDKTRLTIHDSRGRTLSELNSSTIEDSTPDDLNVNAVILRKQRIVLEGLTIKKEGVYEIRFWDMGTGRVVMRRKFGIFVSEDPKRTSL